MTTKERTLLFNIAVAIYNIILGLVIEGFLIFACWFILIGLPEESQKSVPVNVLLPFILIIGLIAAISISRNTVIWALDRFDLRDKLDPKLSKRYPRKHL